MFPLVRKLLNKLKASFRRHKTRDAATTQGDTFANAHDFVIENFAYTINQNQTEDKKKAEEAKRQRKAEEAERRRKADDALERLLTRAMPSAMLYSEARAYAPRCNEDTRQSLRSHLVRWGRNDGEIRRLLWLSGPAAVGKSAIAQTVAEELKNAELLGAVFFFSRPNNRSDPNAVIPTLVYQLALLLPPYKLIIGQRFKDDPLIFDKSRRSQFKELITDPFLPDLSQRPLTFLAYLSERLLIRISQRPLLIVLDGLDECSDPLAQCEFVEMISHHAQMDSKSRLRWMICSRPEPHLEVAFSSEDYQDIFRHEKLEVDNTEARKDALRILEKGFADIKKRYPYQLSHNWPDQTHIIFIADQASGHLGFASSIIRFIGDRHYDDPSGQLKVCLKFLKRNSNHGDPNPLHVLDLLYTQILSDIQKNTLPITHRVLGLFILYGDERLSALVHTNFLGLDQAGFYRSLQRLHSVVSVPPPHEAWDKPIRVYHASFTDYLMDPARAGEFVLDEREVHLDVANCSAGWFSHFCKNPSDTGILSELTWFPLLAKRTVIDTLRGFCHRTFLQVPESFLVSLKSILAGFTIDSVVSKLSGQVPDVVSLSLWLLLSLQEKEVSEGLTAKALRKIAPEASTSAILGSEERVYVPRCNEDTRQGLRNHLSEWVRETGEVQSLLWLSGPAGVGKSAVAQTVAEDMKVEGRLGAEFFFSRQSDPNVVIPRLVCQLALLLPPYRLIVARKLQNDPTILTQSRRQQFDAFFTDPFLISLSQRPLTFLFHQLLTLISDRPPLIVLDGLDECNDLDAQWEFVELFTCYAQKDKDSRLRWMICSRPEPDLMTAFSSEDNEKFYISKKLEFDDSEARNDILRILNKGFAKIRKRYPSQLSYDWPDQSLIQFIADRASCHLGFASCIVQFIGDRTYRNPSHQLDVCLRFLRGIHDDPENLNPLLSLDLLYTQILSNVSEDIFPTTQRILGLSILYGNEQLSALAHANFLGLKRGAFYNSLRHLYSIVLVPPTSEASAKSIRIYHDSFSDYLRDPARAGKFALDEGAVHLDVATRSIGWLGHVCKSRSARHALPELTWVATSCPEATVINSICDFAFTPCWRAFPRAPEYSRATLLTMLEKFDFNLDYSKWDDWAQDFAYFIRWLLSQDAKTLGTVDSWNAGPGNLRKKGGIKIQWYDEDPHAFVQPFLRNVGPADHYSIRLRLGKHRRIKFQLFISKVNTAPALSSGQS
ncbi:hypothetical protein D9756_009600 [Leucocoprinus leucothites]|uniref:Nephrocystin 3-like N-terminal domain-containing protein n=1 Tax=Leucocoprinus leucothites TaxID=201217 RepID=A0A8H5FSX0_9AGAR|nr:hypothetical protein D9756_009600 [Leucoagaricus leucothites]